MLHNLLWIAAIIAIFVLVCFGYHRYRLKKEEKLREPLGQLVDITGTICGGVGNYQTDPCTCGK